MTYPLDLIEIACRLMPMVDKWGGSDRRSNQINAKSGEAIQEINERFLEHGVGYEFVDGDIIRKDSQFIHSNVVKESLRLIQAKDFEGAEEEFHAAFERHRQGDYKSAVQNAAKAFESAMRTICEKMEWQVPRKATARNLLDIMFDKNLLPDYLMSHFASFRATLESGLPTIRNNTSGHGQGEAVQSVPAHISAYCIHLAATNIVLLIECYAAPSRE